MIYKKEDYIDKVAEFHELFDSPVIGGPRLPTPVRAELRVSLIQEELNELKLAFAKGDIVEVADALADLQYVLTGTVLECGMHHKFQELFDEVHRSNMTKACENYDEALRTQDKYHKQGVATFRKRRDGKIIICRSSDNKVLKNINYKPVNLTKILNNE